jgi:type II secretory pathway component PulF
VLIQQVSDPQLKNAITDIRDRVVNGESFAETLGEYSDYFDVIYISMVRVGEVTGTLPASLASIAAFMTKRQRLDSKMATAMIYPEILLVACIGAIIFLTIKVIPVVAEQITATGEKLPFVTVAMLAISDVMTSYWAFAIAFAVLATIWSVRRFVATPKGAFVKDKIMLSLPVFGPLIKQQIVARFASTLSTLLESGLSMADSLKVVAEVTGNTIMNKAVNQARERIMSGSDIATPLRDSGVIDPTIAHMVVVGERSGELEQMLKNIAENLEANSDVVIERLSAAIEPVIVVFMAILIGIIAYATLVPIIRYSAGQF